MAMIVAGAAVLFSEESTAASDNNQYYSGDLDGLQPLYGNVYINDDLTILAGGVLYVEGNLTIDSGVTVNVNDGGMIVVNPGEGETSSLVTINGTLTIQGEGVNNTFYDWTDGEQITPSTLVVVGSTPDGEQPEFKDSGIIINNSVTVTDGAQFIVVDSEITTGGTSPIENGTSVGSILVAENGVLNVTKKSSDVATIGTMNVYVAVGGTFNYSGTTTGDGVTVLTYATGNGPYTTASATISTQSGREEGRNTSNLTFTNVSSNVTGYTAEENATEAKAQNIRQFALNVDGSVANYDKLTLSGNSTGLAGTTYYTSADAAIYHENTTQDDGNKFSAYNDFVKGVATVTGSLTIGENTIFDIDSTAYVIVSGAMKVDRTYDGAGTQDSNVKENVTISGVIEITGTVTAHDKSLAGDGFIAMNGGTATIDYFMDGAIGSCSFYGAYYIDDDDVAHASDLASALEGAAAAGVEEVSVFATHDSENSEIGYGGYIVSSDITIPDNVELLIADALVINNGATVTISANAAVDFDTSTGNYIFVNGKLVDNDTGVEENQMIFEVKSVDDSGEIDVSTYCSLATALAETTSGTIYLYDDVVIDGTMTIGENVTVQYAEDRDLKSENTTAGITFHDKDAVLVVNGVLYLNNKHTITTQVGSTEDYAKITVNNMIVSDSDLDYNDLKVAGMYLPDNSTIGDYEEIFFITSPAVAAQNSSGLDGTIYAYGTIAFGDVTFTKGENANSLEIALVNSGTELATGNITLVGEVTFTTRELTAGTTSGTFTGTITAETTSGTSVISFEKMKGAVVSVDTFDNADGTTETRMLATGDNTDDNQSPRVTNGKTTIVSGIVYIAGEATYSNLTIDEGATLVVPEGTTIYVPDDLGVNTNVIAKEFPLYTEDNLMIVASLVVNGTLTIEGDAYSGADSKFAADTTVINGTVNAGENTTIEFTYALVNGTIASEGTVSATCFMIGGTVSGDYLSLLNVVYAGADTANADIFGATANSTPDQTTYYVNGDEYVTVYADNTAPYQVPLDFVMLFVNISGLNDDTAKFYSDAEMKNAINGIDISKIILDSIDLGSLLDNFCETYDVGAFSNVYISIEPDMVEGTISAGTGLDLYIDNIKWDQNNPYFASKELYVGEHTVSFDVRAGYDGSNATITFNGQTVENGGTITITEAGFTILASGAVPQSSVVVDSGSSDSGMGLTDYLLIILVVLIVIMAIMVAMRLMRS